VLYQYDIYKAIGIGKEIGIGNRIDKLHEMYVKERRNNIELK